MRHSPPRILVATARAGALGHAVLAENYLELLLDQKEYDARLLDVFPCGGQAAISGSKVYSAILTRAPSVWRFGYRHLSNNVATRLVKKSVLPRLFDSAVQEIASWEPDLMISTHPVSSAVINWVRRKHRSIGKWVIALSDWHFNPFWVFDSADKYFVTSEHQQREVAALVPADRIELTGLLLSSEYYHQPQLTNTTIRLADTSRPIIVLISGGTGWQLDTILRELCRSHISARVFVIAGTSSRQASLRQFEKISEKIEISVLGFVDPFPYLLAADLVITKPGTLSTAQALALRKRLVLVVPMPGHEEENAEFLAKHGGCRVLPLDGLSGVLPELLREEVPVTSSELLFERTPSLALSAIRTLLCR